jgi:hypothetical protein
MYLALLQYCSVVDPQSDSTRYSIGFGRADWSLTETGRAYQHSHPAYTPEDMMLAEGAFRPGGAELLWTPKTIALAAGALLVTYIVGFVMWTAGFGFLVAARDAAG